MTSPYLSCRHHSHICRKLFERKLNKNRSPLVTFVLQFVGDHHERRCDCDLDHRQRPRHSRRIDTEVGNDGRRIGRGRVRDWSDGLSTDNRHSVIIVTGRSCVFEPATIYSQRKPFFRVLQNYKSVDRDSVHERRILSRSLSIVRVCLDL